MNDWFLPAGWQCNWFIELKLQFKFERILEQLLVVELVEAFGFETGVSRIFEEQPLFVDISFWLLLQFRLFFLEPKQKVI